MPSAIKTETIQLNQWQQNECPKMDDFNSNNLKIDNKFKNIDTQLSDITKDRIYYGGTSTGSGNAYAITIDSSITSYAEPLAISFKANYNSTGITTINVNGLGAKTIKKANGNNVTNLIAGSIYTMRYNGTNFILQGEGGSGTAIASDILLGKTASTDAGDIVGTISSKASATYSPSTSAQTISAGQYLSGAQTINPVTGTATPADVVAGKTFSSANGINQTGTATIPSLGGKRFATGTATSSSTTSACTDISGSSNHMEALITVTGLSFKPSVVIIKGISGSNNVCCVYSEATGNSYAKTAKSLLNGTSSGGISGYDYKGDISPLSVVSGGFTLPVVLTGVTCNWLAIE